MTWSTLNGVEFDQVAVVVVIVAVVVAVVDVNEVE